MSKSIFFLATLVLAFGLSGCGSSEPNFYEKNSLALKEGLKNFRTSWHPVNQANQSPLGVLSQSLENGVLEIKLEKGSKVGEHIQIFIDSDYNDATGYRDDFVDGADYLIEGDTIYQSTANSDAWSWKVVGSATYSETKERFYVQTTTDVIQNIHTPFRVSAMSWDGVDWDRLVSYIKMAPIASGGIVIDASSSEWGEVPVLAESSMGKLKMTEEGGRLYFLIEKGNLGQYVQIYLNIDNDTTTGHASDVLDYKSGAEYMIEEDRLYQSTANGSSWSWKEVGNVKFAKDGNTVEIAVSKAKIGIGENISSIGVGAIGWDSTFENVVSSLSMHRYTLKQNGGESGKGIVISEVMAANAHTMMDPDFLQFSDWIELYNDSASTIDLSGYKLSDKLDEASWEIPSNTTIPPHGYLLFWADKKDYVGKGYHTDFSLKSKGESIALFDPEENFVTGFTFPKQKADISCAQNEQGEIVYMNPTPARSNTAAYKTLTLSKKPTFSLESGFYTNAQTVSIEAESGASIYYTTDGSFPSKESTLYREPITIDKTTVIRARAFLEGKFLSEAETRTYFIGEEVHLPVVSIAIADKYLHDDRIGIYTVGTNGAPAEGCEEGPQVANFYQKWKRPANIEYFDQKGTLGFSQEFNLKISGSCTRALPQKSLSISADSKYGKGSLKYKLFPHKSIKKIKGFKLKSAGQDWEGTMLRDAFMQQVVKDDMDVEYQDYQPCVVFINGEYWGIHNIREKKNEHFLAENHPEIDAKKVDLLQDNGDADEGSGEDYVAMLDFIKNHSLSNSDNYNTVAAQMDVENYMDYIIAETYFANTDWPYTNVRFWREKKNSPKWRWILEDLDQGLGEPWGDFIEVNMLQMLTSTENLTEQNPLWATFLFRSLIENSTFKSRFKQKYTTYLNTTFKTERVLAILDQIVAKIDPEIARHAAKWGQTTPYVFKDYQEWQENVAHLKEVIQTRNDVVRKELSEF